MLRVRGLHAYYGKSHVLHGVDFDIAPGEIVALLGRNGSGRSTTAKALMGLVQAHGECSWNGQSLTGLPPHRIARLGLGYVPENRDIFPRLSVAQNLLLGIQPGKRTQRWGLADMYAMFPRLQERAAVPAGMLSGGEQQMLTLCRTLMGDPALIIVDEPTEGLAPMMVQAVADFLKVLRSRHISVLLIEQKLTIALDISDRVLVMGHGQVVYSGTSAEFRQQEAVRREWLEIS
ncbi:MAG: ABC transporter ATP-binding protein [Alphaproteobacteria bacterium]|nr:ABC transporter ATP-binding protein [Alphaproteobacteria bacterium]